MLGAEISIMNIDRGSGAFWSRRAQQEMGSRLTQPCKVEILCSGLRVQALQ